MTDYLPLTTLESIAQAERSLYWPVFARLPVCFEWGKGTKIYDLEGKEYLDFISGIGVALLGHAHPAVTQAIREQAELLISCSNVFYSRPQLHLLQRLAAHLPGGRWFLSNSGAEANEAAIKLARAYGRPSGRFRIITALNSFHGRTLATLAATGQRGKQEKLEPLPDGFDHVPFNDIDALARAITPETVAIMLEPVQGEGGVYPARREYLARVAEVCRERGLLLILDEVQTGLGRTGAFFAFEQFGVEPDILTLAKGLANGIPIGATWAREDIANVLAPGDHGSTYGGNALACAAAAAVVATIDGEELHLNAAARGEQMAAGLAEIASRSGGIIAEIRSAGLMCAVEFTEPIAATLVDVLREKGVIVGKVRETIVRMLPPLIVEEHDVNRFLSVFDEALREVAAR